MAIKIRSMMVDDLPQVYKLGLTTFDVWEVPYQAWTVREVAYHFEAEADHCFVAEDDGKVVGFSLGAETYDIMTDTGQIEWTAVHPDYHGQGIGSRLFQTNCNSLFKKGKRRVVTDVTQKNDEANRMVEQSGFHIVATVNLWIRENENVEASLGGHSGQHNHK